MMRKLFIRFSMLLFVLGMSIDTAWAFDALMEQLQNEVYFAELTAMPSATGSGKVYITEKDPDTKVPVQELPTDFDWDAQDESSVVSRGVGAVIEGMEMVQVPFIVYCKANDGWYFKGWSYTQDGSDLESLAKAAHFDGQIGVIVDPSNVAGDENAKPYTIYATFDKIYVSDYTVEGSNTVTKNGSTTQTVTFSLVGNDLDANDFSAPSIVSTTGEGTWSSEDGDDLAISDVTVNTTLKQASVVVKFTAPDADDAESKAVLRFGAKSGSQLDVTLSARTTSSSEVEAFLYNGQTKIGEGGTVADLLDIDVSAYKNPIIKLNKNYEGIITIAKKIALDLNGYTLGGLTINSGADAALAYSPFGGIVNGDVEVAGGKLTMNGGAIEGDVSVSAGATMVLNGAAVSGNVANEGTLTTSDGSVTGSVTSSGTLTINGGTFTNADGIAIKVTNGTAQIKKGAITGSSYGVQTEGGETTISKLAVIRATTKALNGAGGTLTVNNGKFTDPDDLMTGSVVFNAGYFQTNRSSMDAVGGKPVWHNTSGAEFKENYLYFAASEEDAKASGMNVCRIGKSFYSSLEDALAYANNTTDEVIIVMENDYTLPAGYYTLPDNATLIVPMQEHQDAGYEVVPRNAADEISYIPPTKYCKLTLASGVNMDVHGTIEVSGSQLSTNETYTGASYGPYGQIHMNQGSKMVLQNASVLRAWGFVTGSGEIDARRGSVVRELFQVGDWKDFYFSGTGLLLNSGGGLGEEVFPITQYYIQNIEAPVKYHPGANLSAAVGVYAFFPKNMLGKDRPPFDMNVIMTANNISIVGVTGDDAMFLMDANGDEENTWVRKWYDTSKDQQVYEINSGAHIGKLVIPLVYALGSSDAVLDMNSGAYNLPITNNFKLHLLSGEMAFTQATALLPGSEVEVDKEATVYVYNNQESVGLREGQLYVYDAAEWGEYAMGAKARQVLYSPSFNGAPNIRDLENLEDASINVHGTFDTQGGYVYTTASGANIFSTTEDAGTFVFSVAPEEEQKTASITQVKDVVREDGTATRVEAECNLAYLRNSDAWVTNGGAQYQETASATEGSSFCYMDIDGKGGRWTILEKRQCVTYDAATKKCYIKSQEFVEIAVTDSLWNADAADWDVFTGNDDHTFSDAAGAGRLFILAYDKDYNCQWWEVEQKDNLYHCVHPENDTYYEWNEGDEEWQEVKFTITWKNWNGDIIQTTDKEGNPQDSYVVTYGTLAEFFGTNPTRDADDDYTYDFTGWSPALGKVTSDVTYTATYEKKQIKYTIAFVQDGGMEIERHLLARNEVPVCENTPTRTGYILQWDPAIAAVTGNQTYTATWLPEAPTEYEVTFYDYDGTTKLQPTGDDPYMVAVGAMPEYSGATPSGKDATDEFTYVFDHWSPEIEAVSATSVKSYTAVYREVAKTYTIRFFQADGETPIGENQTLTYGAVPVVPTVGIIEPGEEGYTYTYVWENMEDATKTVEAVKADADYKPRFTGEKIKYTVTLKSNPSGACTLSGAGVYKHGDPIAISSVATSADYEFVNWTDASGNEVKTLPTMVTGDITLTANYNYKGDDKVTITWNNWDGSLLATSKPKSGSATTYTGTTPTKEATSEFTYTFYGWTAASDSKTYKNGLTPKAIAAETYTASFNATTNQYTVTLQSNLSGVCTFTGAGTYDYGTNVDITIIYDSEKYNFTGWSDAVTEANRTISGLASDVTLTANFTPIALNDHTVETGETWNVPVGAEVKDLIVESNGDASGQLQDVANLTIRGEAVYRLNQSFAAGQWYAVAVPWRVDPNTGIYAGSSRLSSGSQIYIIEFDANAYASADKQEGRRDYWKFLDETGNDMVPGKLYMIYLTSSQTSLDFHKKDGASILTNSTSVAMASGSIAEQSNWNAIANPALYYADLSTGAEDGQKYNGNDSYITGSTTGMIVGEPMFVQVNAKSLVYAIPAVGGAAPAPAYRLAPQAETADNRFMVELVQNGQLADRLIVQTAEEKAEEYVIGKDLAKFGISTKVAQMWMNRYDAKLCKNTVELNGERADYPLSIYAPASGEYTLSAMQKRGDADLYLTLNGEAIWNLSEAPYTLSLQKGNTAEYGLRISVRKAPEIVTGMDEAVVEAQGDIRKVLVNDKVFIIRGEKVYTIDGQIVK